jgi:hypothetical protein
MTAPIEINIFISIFSPPLLGRIFNQADGFNNRPRWLKLPAKLTKTDPGASFNFNIFDC